MATTKRPRAKKSTAASAEVKETPVVEKSPAGKQVKAAKKASAPKQAATQAAPAETRKADLQEAIRVRAYELFVQRGCQHGADFEDWLRAEMEILNSVAAAA